MFKSNNQVQCRNTANLIQTRSGSELSTLRNNQPDDSFTKHLLCLEKANYQRFLRRQRKLEADKLVQTHGHSYSDSKFWWNDSSLKHVTKHEEREAKRQSKNATLDRKTQRKHKSDNCQANKESGHNCFVLISYKKKRAVCIACFEKNQECWFTTHTACEQHVIRHHCRCVGLKDNAQSKPERQTHAEKLKEKRERFVEEMFEKMDMEEKWTEEDWSKLIAILLEQNLHPADNAQIGATISIPGIEALTAAIRGIQFPTIPTNLNHHMPDLSVLTPILTTALTEIKDATNSVKNLAAKPFEVEHRFGLILDPIASALSQVRNIGWKGILIDFILFLSLCYLAEWKRSVIVTALTSFIWNQRHFFKEVVMVNELMTMVGGFVPVEEDNKQTGEDTTVIGGIIASICVVLAAIGLGKLPGGKTTNDLFNRLSRVGACMSSIALMKEFFSGRVNDILDYFRVEWFGYKPAQLNEWAKYETFCEEVEKLRTTDLERDIPSNLTLKNHVDSLIAQGDSILKEIEKLKIPPIKTTRFKSHYIYLDRVRSLVASGGGGMHAPRIPAQIIHFYGETGVGKSELTSMLNAHLLASQGFTKEEDFHRLIYYRDSSQERFDGYISQVQGVVIDDYGSRHDSVNNPNPEPLEIIRMSNGAVWKLDMPNLAEKGNTFFSAKWVILTSNQSNFKWDSLTNPEAVARRIALKYRQYPAPEFMKRVLINNRQVETLDVEKVEAVVQNDPTAYSKVWLFDKEDGTNKTPNPLVVKLGMTFDQVAEECINHVTLSQHRGSRRLNATNAMFRKCVEKYAKKQSCAPGCTNHEWCENMTFEDAVEELPEVPVAEIPKPPNRPKDIVEHPFHKKPPTTPDRPEDVVDQYVPYPRTYDEPALTNDEEFDWSCLYNRLGQSKAFVERERDNESDAEYKDGGKSAYHKLLYESEESSICSCDGCSSCQTSDDEDLPDNHQMMEEMTQDPAAIQRHMQKLKDEREKPKLKKACTKEKTATTTIYASSKAEMLSKTDAWCDYIFGSGGGGGDPYRNNKGHRHFESIHDHPGIVSLNEMLPHDSTFKPTIIERISGKTHIDLSALVTQNPDYVDKEFLKNFNDLPISPTPTNYAPLLMQTCVIVPEKELERFANAYATAINIHAVYSGADTIERCYQFKILPDSSLMVFNQVMDYCLQGDSLKKLGIEVCPEHFDGPKYINSIYSFMTKSHDMVSQFYSKASLWASWIKTELIFTSIRAVALVGISIGMTALWTWLTKPTQKKSRKNANAESKSESRTLKSYNAESHQSRDKAARATNTESHQSREKAAAVTNTESHQSREKAAAQTNTESDNVEACSDQNALEIQNKLYNNIYSIANADLNVPLGFVFFIKGRLAITNRHIARMLREKVIISNSHEFFTATTANIVVTEVSKESLHYDKDVVLLEFPQHVRVMADVSRYFMTKEDFRLHRALAKVSLVSHREAHKVKQANLCKAVDTPFELRVQGVATLIREAYEYNIDTVKGDCGSVLVALDKNFERKIIGIHMAAGVGIYTGVAVAIHADFMKELEAAHPLRHPESKSNGQCNIPCIPIDEKKFEGSYLPLGEVETIYQPLKSNIYPSPLHGVIAEPLTLPAKLSRFRKDDVIVDPFVNARKKALTESVEIDQDILKRATHHYSQVMMRNIDPTDQRVLTIAEAIAGIENEPTYLPIKRNTSPGGLPTFHGWTKTGKGKRNYLDNGDGTYRTDHPLVLQKVDEMLTRLKAGERSDTVWIDTLKDERRTIEKVEAGKTRLFAAGEMAFLIIFRQYFFGFASHMMRNRIQNESCVGINVYSQEWTTLANRMRSRGKHIIAGDFTNYDGTLSATMLWSCLDVIEDFYDGTDEERSIRRMIWLDIVNSVHVSGNQLYVWSHSQPSGCPITALLNSLYHSISARYVYIVCAKKYAPDQVSLLNFDQYVCHNNYGDDDLWNISDEIVSWFNQETISEAYATIGMTYTDELKTGTLIPTRTLDEVQFLKRKFRYDRNQSRYRCPLSIDTILEMAMWNHGTKNIVEITGDTLQEAVYELSHHSEETFDEHMPRFKKAQKIIPVPLAMYDEYQETEYFKYVC